MRQIKASEVKPGMTIRWDDGYGMQEITPSKVVPLDTQTPPATIFEGDWGVWRVAASDRMITVLSEPQPEEPTEFGARVIVDGVLRYGHKMLRTRLTPTRVRGGCGRGATHGTT